MIAACPGCGAPIEFRYDDTFVRVCGHCHTGILRADRALQTLGKLSDLTEIPSAVALGMRGRYLGNGFEVLGMVELRQSSGGAAREYHLRFDDGRWGWLAEAQGRLYLTFEEKETPQVRPWASLFAGLQLSFGDAGHFVVNELGHAELAVARGEIPFRFVPHQVQRFADLTNATSGFATLDFGAADTDTPRLFLGCQVALEELGLAGGRIEPYAAPAIRGAKLECKRCGAPVEIHQAKLALRFGCPYCGAQHEVHAGLLQLLAGEESPVSTLTPPLIPLGSLCRFRGTEYRVLGYVQRAIELHGVKYAFSEWLLHEQKVGFRWLVESDGHFSFVEPVAPGAVRRGAMPEYDGVSFRWLQAGEITVQRVCGEFYWNVRVGDTCRGVDYFAPPCLLSHERSGLEEHFSLGTYLSPKEVARAFAPLALVMPPVAGVAPNQPNPVSKVGSVLIASLAGIILLAILLAFAASDRVVFKTIVYWTAPPQAAATDDVSPTPAPEFSRVWFSQPFELHDREIVEIRLNTAVSNSWQWIAGDLVNESTAEFASFERDIEFYFGTEDGESWVEGERTARLHLNAPPGGRYVLRLETSDSQPWLPPGQVEVELRAGVFPRKTWLFALLVVTAPGLSLGLYGWWFEKRRLPDADDEYEAEDES